MLARGYIGGMILVGGGAAVAALLVMTATTPLTIGPIGVTLWFLLIFVALGCLLAAASYAIDRYVHSKGATTKQLKSSWRRGAMFGGVATILLALSSLKQLNIRDALLLVLLIVLVEFYTVARA